MSVSEYDNSRYKKGGNEGAKVDVSTISKVSQYNPGFVIKTFSHGFLQMKVLIYISAHLITSGSAK